MNLQIEYPSLTVPRDQLKGAIQAVSVGLGRKGDFRIRMEFADGEMSLHGVGASTSIDAEGRWPGVALVSARVLKSVATRLPSGDFLHVSVRDGRFYIEAWSISAEWQDISPPAITVPINHAVVDILVLAKQKPKAVLVSSGLWPLVEQAKAELSQKLTSAAKVLGPLGITLSDLDCMIQK